MRPTCGVHVVWHHFVPEPSTSFFYVSWSVLWLRHQVVTDVTVLLITPNLSCSKNRKLKRKMKRKRNKNERENKIKSTINDLDNVYLKASMPYTCVLMSYPKPYSSSLSLMHALCIHYEETMFFNVTPSLDSSQSF